MLSQHAPDCCVREPNPPSLSPETIPLNDFYLSGIISLRMSVSTIETYATTFERVKRISADCSSAEWIARNRTLLCYRVPLLSTLHCTVLRSASDTVWYTEKPGAYVPRVFILRSVAVVINIAYLGILCDHVPDFNIDFGFLIPYALFPKPCPSPTFITRRISQNCQLPTHKLTGLFGNYMGLACSLRLTHFSQSPLLIFEQF